MKSKHRHELKTNELAEWIANFPQWAKENRITIAVVLLAIIAVGALYIWKIHNRSVSVQNQIELTTHMSQLLGSKMQILKAQSQGTDLSYMLLQLANSLKRFAQTVNSKQMAAFALLKRADTLRTELHYRLGAVSRQDLTAQINEAMASYNEVIEKAPSPSLMATAKFGLGLCEEELANFEKAQQIYQETATNPDYEGTIAATSAKHRLKIMTDYKTKIVFKRSVEPKPSTATQPKIEIKPVDINNLPIEIKPAPQEPNSVSDPA
jgi:tetratricopeptide (TPR) repeat protein